MRKDEQQVANALHAANIVFSFEKKGETIGVFYLPDFDAYILTESATHEVTIQGIDAARTFYKLLNGNIL